jgi:hypothetical protein
MAIKNTPPESEEAVQKPTPESTPVPGGGSWTWDPVLSDWVPSAPYAPPAISA